MKNVLLLITFLLSFANIQAQKGYYYGSKFIELKTDNSKSEQIISSTLQKSKTLSSYSSKIYYSSNKSGAIIVLPKLIIKLEEGRNIENVLSLFEGKVSLTEQYNNTYYCNCATNSSDDVLSFVAKIAKLNGVIWCEPDMYSSELTSENNKNPLYNNQYYLKNTGTIGTAGIDINVEPAWKMVSGSPSITVAVIDTGVDLNHEDLEKVILPGYTVNNATGYGAPQYWNKEDENEIKDKAHGTNCAGIIGAIDNNVGIKGVASGVKILPVNIVPYLSSANNTSGMASNSEIAQAIRWTYPQSDILSCSWKCFVESNNVRDAILEARTKGRNGKGCVVVFAAGNSTSNIDFPANVEGVITVGAIDEKGKVTTYSNYGEELNLVAPGESITTTNTTPTNDSSEKYIYDFNGTSAACPQVAGVAALMLSANPKLSEFDVREILQETARDLGPKGWDKDYGYGLVDAAKAVASSYVERLSIVGPSTVIDNEFYTIENLPNGCKVQWSQRNISSTITSMAVLDQDEPDENVVTVTNLHGFSIALTARIEFPGGFIYELSRDISGPTPTMSAYYFEVYSDGSKSFQTPLLEDTYGEINMATPPNDIVVTSDCFYGRRVTYRYSDSNHAGADGEVRVLGNYFVFEMPALTKGRTMDFTVWYNNTIALYKFKFGANTVSTNSSLSLIPLGNNKYRLKTNLEQESKLSSLDLQTHTINVFDIQKKVVKSQNIKNNDILDVSNLAKGLYIVTVTTNREKYSQKINVN